MAYSDRVFLVMCESEEGNFSAQVVKDQSVLDSFENLAKTSDGKKARVTLIELQYNDDVVINAVAKVIPKIKKNTKIDCKLGNNNNLQ